MENYFMFQRVIKKRGYFLMRPESYEQYVKGQTDIVDGSNVITKVCPVAANLFRRYLETEKPKIERVMLPVIGLFYRLS